MPRVAKRKRKLKPALPAKFQQGFIAELDCRTLMARTLRQRFAAIADDLGGEDQLSNLIASLLERCIFLEAMLTKIESDLTLAKDGQDSKAVAETLARWVQLVNSFQGIAAKLGLDRTSRNPWEAHDRSKPTAPEPSE